MHRLRNWRAPVLTRCWHVPRVDFVPLMDSDVLLNVFVELVDKPDSIYAVPVHPDATRELLDEQVTVFLGR